MYLCVLELKIYAMTFFRIFGALQYWMSWMFLLVIFGGSFIAMFNCIKSRRTRRNLSLDGDQEELINSDDETT